MYSEYQAYYETFRTGYWAAESADECPCHGSGWTLSEVDTWHKCPVHFCGQLGPEAQDSFCSGEDSFEADNAAFMAADYESRLEWAVARGKASYSREEQSRRDAAAAMTLADRAVSERAVDDGEIPF